MKKHIAKVCLLLTLLLLCGCGAKEEAEPETAALQAEIAQTLPPEPETAEATEAAETTAATEPAPPEKTGLDVVVGWYGYEDQQWWEAFEAEFETAYPGIDLTVQVRGWVELRNGLEETEEKPDILNVTAWNAWSYRKDGLLLNADAYLSQKTRESIYPRLLDWYEADGSVWGTPIVSIPWVMVYNPELLEAAQVTLPTDWEQLSEACRSIHSAMPEVIPWGMDMITGEGLLLWLLNNGGGFVTESGEWFINSDENLEAVEYLRDMFRAGWVTEELPEAESFTLRDRFLQGEVAMMVLPMNALGLLEQEGTVPYALAPIPANVGRESASLAAVDYLVCFDKGQTAPELEAMEAFFDFFYESDRHRDYAENIGHHPVTAGAVSDPVLERALSSARTLPEMKWGYQDIYRELDNFWWYVLEEGENPGRLLDELQYEAD